MNLQPTIFFPAGAVIYKAGDEPVGVYLICSGKVQIFFGDDEKCLLLATLGEKQTFGEMALIAGRKRGASAIALEPTWCFLHNADGFAEKMKDLSPDLREIFDNLIEVIKRKNYQYITDKGIDAKFYADEQGRQILPIFNKFDILNNTVINSRIKNLDVFMRSILFSLLEIACS